MFDYPLIKRISKGFGRSWEWTKTSGIEYPPLNWVVHAFSYVRGPSGYTAIGTLAGVYLGIFALVSADYERSVQTAEGRVSNFFALANSSNLFSFEVAVRSYWMADEARVLEEPALFAPIRWWRRENVKNYEVLLWLSAASRACTAEVCGSEKWRIDLPELEASSTELLDVDFTHANLAGSNLSHSEINGEFSNADLSRSILRGVEFWVDANGASFQKSYLENSRFISSRSFEGHDVSSLVNANFKSIRGKCADFGSVELVGSDFSDAHLLGAVFADANISNTIFDGADLRGANFEGAHGVETASFVGAKVLAGTSIAQLHSKQVSVDLNPDFKTYCRHGL